ncbi:uncharacterized protein TNCV_3670931 [Trichonephila clavipes]|nr:uncharacterized protein TNCV_3670931 [Trichonephila clavipes]
MVYALSSLQWLLRTVSSYSEPASVIFLACAGQSIRVISSLSSSSSTARVRCGRVLSSIKGSLGQWHHGTDAQGTKYLLTIAIPDYRHSIKNEELSSPVPHNDSPDKNSRTTVMVSFLDVTGIKPCPDVSPNQNALRIASGTEPTLSRKEDTTPLTVVQFLCSLHHCKRWRRWSISTGGSVQDGGRINTLC